MPQAEPISRRPRPVSSRLTGVWRQPNSNGPKARVHYPDSDGEPMGESFLHIDVATDARTVLLVHHADRADACVGGNNFVYYEEGNPRAVVVPDVFVVFGVPKRTDRRVFKVWEEGGRVPDFVLEVTSRKTRRNDEGQKKDLYERLGVAEYWQFDPTGDYLDPILKGRALADGRYRELGLERRDGGLCRLSEVLGLDLRLEAGRLRFFDPKRGEYLLTPEEQQQVNREQRQINQEQRQALDERDQALEERDRTVDQQRRALEAAEARIRELERQRRPDG